MNEGLLPQNGASPTNEADIITSAGDADFEAKVLQASLEIPIIVDFWAPWCEPCKALTPILERLVRGAGGAIRLVKFNVDENKMVASQLGVQSIPMVFAFYQGQAIDGFSGNVGEQQVQAMVDKLMTMSGSGQAMQDLESLVTEGDSLRTEKDYTGALQNYAGVLQHNPEHVGAIAGLLHCYIGLGEVQQAEQVIGSLPDDVKNHADIQSVQRMLELQNSSSGEDLSGLAQAASDKSNLQACYDFACARFGAGEQEEAMNDLLDICRANMQWNEQAARLKLLELFEALGSKDSRVIDARKQLSSLLFS